MYQFVFIIVFVSMFAGFAGDVHAQDAQQETPKNDTPKNDTPKGGVPAPKLDGPIIIIPKTPDIKKDDKEEGDTNDEDALAEGDPSTFKAPPKSEAGKDLTVRSEEGRAEMLQTLFLTLKNAPDAETGELIAEEIWAVFLQSGSASVDFALLRGISAQTRGDKKLARRMYDHVMRLEPDYAEGWSRSGRLAIEEDDLNRALSDTKQSLIIEPRHFYALWTLGNILEKLGKQDAAFEAYREAYKLYPEHKKIKERVDSMTEVLRGKAL